MPIDEQVFAAEVALAYGFLNDRGFTGPARGNDALRFASDRLVVEVAHDETDGGRLTTVLEAEIGGRAIRARLRPLYAAARFGPEDHVRQSARSPHSLRLALASQAEALQLLLPVLEGPEGRILIAACRRA